MHSGKGAAARIAAQLPLHVQRHAPAAHHRTRWCIRTCAAPCRIATCLPLYVDVLCTSACAALGIQNGVPIAQTVWGGASLLHTGVSPDGVASGLRFSRWRRFRISMKSQHQGRRAEGRSVSAVCQTHRSSGLRRSSRRTPNASI